MSSPSEQATQRVERKELAAREKLDRAQTRAAKSEKVPAGKRLADRLLTLIELGGIALIIHLFRRPLKHLVRDIARELEIGAVVIKDGLKKIGDQIEADEKALRSKIIAAYHEDPILMHKIGPQLWEQLTNADWANEIYSEKSAIPSAVEDNFIVGTGRGATTLRSTIVRGISVQHLAIAKWLVGNSADLNEIGRFENPRS